MRWRSASDLTVRVGEHMDPRGDKQQEHELIEEWVKGSCELITHMALEGETLGFGFKKFDFVQAPLAQLTECELKEIKSR